MTFATLGIPLTYAYPASSCPYWGPSIYCYNYNPLIVGFDCLFWVGIAFALVSFTDTISSKWTNKQREVKYDERAELKFFATLFSFGLAILFVWLGLANQVVGISGWYLGAIIVAIFGLIVLKLPTSNKGEERR